MERFFFSCGAIFGFLAVALGAFAAHGLKTKLTPELLTIFETGVRYQMYHALALLVIAWATTRFSSIFINLSGWFFITGIIIFSGSLYILALLNIRWIGAITPIGGLLLLIGWLSLLFGSRR